MAIRAPDGANKFHFFPVLWSAPWWREHRGGSLEDAKVTTSSISATKLAIAKGDQVSGL